MSSVPITARFVIKRHSRRPYLRLQVNDSDGNAFDFTGAIGVTFIMYDEDGVEKVKSAGVIETPVTSGVLRYEWQALDVDTEGDFKAEFDVDYGAGEPMTLPLDGYLLVKIYADLDDV